MVRNRISYPFVEAPTGIARDPDVYFDGRKIIFAMRRSIQEDYHLWEVNADGTGLKHLTSAPGVTDISPIYMPDDTVVFSSSREPKYCMCNRHIMCNLYRMDADGANIAQIGKSTLMTNAQVQRLEQLTQVPLSQQQGFSVNPGPQVSFERPELSPCLAKLDWASAQYAEALAIIQAGATQLAARPRGDTLLDFQPCPVDQQRLDKYAAREAIETRNRAAIRAGAKAYDQLTHR